jgi:hypothetical protein
VKPEAMTLRVPVRQESLRLHNKARLARGLAPLPQKRRSRLEQPDAQACPSESAIAAGECEGPTAADPPDLADSLDLVLAQLAMDDECSEGSVTDDDGDHEEGDEPEDVPSKMEGTSCLLVVERKVSLSLPPTAADPPSARTCPSGVAHSTHSAHAPWHAHTDTLRDVSLTSTSHTRSRS